MVFFLGVPFSDPLADGPIIQKANQQALDNGVDSLHKCLDLVKDAREKGLKVPIVFMGYYNPFLAYGEKEIIEGRFFLDFQKKKDQIKMIQFLLKDCKKVGVNGFIITDLPPEECENFRSICKQQGY